MLTFSFSPFPQLVTERLLLREITPDDTAQLFRLRTDAVVLIYLDRAPLQSPAEAELLINKISSDTAQNEGITWAVALKSEPDKLIGTAGLWRIIKEHYRAEIGYAILPEYGRQGYMKEAVNAMINYAFATLNLHSLEANINPANKASEKLLLKCGFEKEAYFRQNYYYDGAFLDSVIYSLINEKV
jgi:[ribosomal protein S5]-alanine N-acetyltransferase